MARLIDAFRSAQINLSEYQSYIDLGYLPSDTIQLNSGRSAEMVTISYMNLGAGRSFTLQEHETIMGYIGPNNDMSNAGNMTIAGDALFLYNVGKFVNTGNLTVTGNLEFKPY